MKEKKYKLKKKLLNGEGEKEEQKCGGEHDRKVKFNGEGNPCRR